MRLNRLFRLIAGICLLVAILSVLLLNFANCYLLTDDEDDNYNLQRLLQQQQLSENEDDRIDDWLGQKQQQQQQQIQINRRSYEPISMRPFGPVNKEEIFLLEDKDYPKSLFEDYSKKVGQVSGISTLAQNNDIVIFHRADRKWTADTKFPEGLKLMNETTSNKTKQKEDLNVDEQILIKNNTLMIIDGETGEEKLSFGSNLFYMPHSVASDSRGNLWISDVGRHQVMRLPAASLLSTSTETATPQFPGNLTRRRLWPDIILGEAFVSGSDEGHFCRPAEIAVSSNGRLVFVADGYCNGRVMVFTSEGQFIKSFGQQQQMVVVHSLALMEEHNLVCVGDREKARIHCYHAGLDGDLDSLGKLRVQLDYPIGRVFALTSIASNHLLVSSNQLDSNRYDLAILDPFSRQLKLVWTSSDLLEPHSLASTWDRQYAYAADVSPDAFKKVFKFNIIVR